MRKKEIRKTILLYLHGGGCTSCLYISLKSSKYASLNPKNIVICGNSAGGGISSFLGLVIRDAGLPSLAGIIGLSPWLGPSILDDECSDYIRNMKRGLVISYVSPMLAESLGDLPPLLLVARDDDKFRDEAIYFAHRASEPTKYKVPSYNSGKFGKSPFQTPTNTTLEIYEEIPHIFQGEFGSLKERRKKFLNWDIIGIVSSNHTKQIVSCK
ncbi:hypothetical protein RhiirA4_522908 [Rhizophagus irregularis]|uniref:Alpha/beta hydrolase fold-3 domain-containing protein n=1 Tax=Rhizophagus irregularis TaxID=588596 RepID=A0A2I1GLS3_9GLOM|nr:hypothetical protein RhiirA4_522908 [Rhizophagus irregularis]